MLFACEEDNEVDDVDEVGEDPTETVDSTDDDIDDDDTTDEGNTAGMFPSRKTYDWEWESDFLEITSGACGTCDILTLQEGEVNTDEDVETIEASGNITTEEREVDNLFTKINVSACATHVVVNQGTASPIQVVAPENLQQYLIIEVVDNELVIRITEGICLKSIDDEGNSIFEMEVFITVPDLEAIGLTNASSMEVENDFETDTFLVELSSASELTFENLNVETFNGRVNGASFLDFEGVTSLFAAQVEGASRLELDHENMVDALDTFLQLGGASQAVADGESDYFDITVSGASQFFGFDHEADTLFIDASGVSNAEVNAIEFLVASIDNLSRVEYIGTPEIELEGDEENLIDGND